MSDQSAGPRRLTHLPYGGPIGRGDRFVWEPDRPQFRSELVVTQVTRWLVRARRTTGGKSFWNPESIFRSAVIPAEEISDARK